MVDTWLPLNRVILSLLLKLLLIINKKSEDHLVFMPRDHCDNLWYLNVKKSLRQKRHKKHKKT